MMKVLVLVVVINSGNFDFNVIYILGMWSFGGGKIIDWVISGWGIIIYKEGFYCFFNVGFVYVE